MRSPATPVAATPLAIDPSQDLPIMPTPPLAQLASQTLEVRTVIATLVSIHPMRAEDGPLAKQSAALEHALAHEGGDAAKHAKHMRDKVVPAMAALRTTGDALEMLVPHGSWPLATYREMLFIK